MTLDLTGSKPPYDTRTMTVAVDNILSMCPDLFRLTRAWLTNTIDRQLLAVIDNMAC